MKYSPRRIRATNALFGLLLVVISLIGMPASALAQIGEWLPAANMHDERTYHSATLLPDGRVLVAGGVKYDPDLSTFLAVNSVEIYDPVMDFWTHAAPMHAARAYHSAVLLSDGRVLVAGGRDRSNDNPDNRQATYVISAEIYDPITGDWTPTSPMHLYSHAVERSVTLLSDGRVLFTGGKVFWSGEVVDWVGIYDPVADDWENAVSPMHEARHDHSATLLPDGRVLVVGGEGKEKFHYHKNAEIYDPLTDNWTLIPIESTFVGPLTLLLDGRLLLIKDSSVEGYVYDPATNSSIWAGSPFVSQPSYSPIGGAAAVTVLQNGWVLKTGGHGLRAAALRTLEVAHLYNPDTNGWATATPMTIPREGHTSTLLPDGQVLVTGGASAERFQLPQW